jgi:hypothetical protein
VSVFALTSLSQRLQLVLSANTEEPLGGISFGKKTGWRDIKRNATAESAVTPLMDGKTTGRKVDRVGVGNSHLDVSIVFT